MNSFGLDDTKLTKTTILAVFCIPASQFCFIKCINRKKKNQFEKSGEDVQNDCQLFFLSSWDLIILTRQNTEKGIFYMGINFTSEI